MDPGLFELLRRAADRSAELLGECRCRGVGFVAGDACGEREIVTEICVSGVIARLAQTVSNAADQPADEAANQRADAWNDRTQRGAGRGTDHGPGIAVRI